MQDINNFTGVGIRLLYSPISKILSIHYFSTNPFSLTDKKYYNEINSYVDSQTVELLSTQGVRPPNNTFLLKGLKNVQEKRKLEDIEITNTLISRVSTIEMLTKLYRSNPRFTGSNMTMRDHQQTRLLFSRYILIHKSNDFNYKGRGHNRIQKKD